MTIFYTSILTNDFSFHVLAPWLFSSLSILRIQSISVYQILYWGYLMDYTLKLVNWNARTNKQNKTNNW